MAYNPYEAENEASQPQTQSPFSLVGEYYKYKYFANPSTWSGSRGIATPFNISPTGESITKYFRAVHQAFKGSQTQPGGFWKATKAANEGFKEMMTAGGGRIFGYDALKERMVREAPYKIRHAYVKQGMPGKLFTYKEDLLEKELAGVMPKDVIVGYSKKKRPKFKAFQGLKGVQRKRALMKAYNNPASPEQKAAVQSIRKALTDRAAALKNQVAKGIMSSQKWQLFARGSLKYGIRAMKAVSVVGAAMMFADIGMMVFQPVGAAIMEEAVDLG